MRFGATTHNDTPVHGLDPQVPDTAAGSPRDRAFQTSVMVVQSETELRAVEEAAELFHQSIGRERLGVIDTRSSPFMRRSFPKAIHFSGTLF
jgi:hypothetical protein